MSPDWGWSDPNWRCHWRRRAACWRWCELHCSSNSLQLETLTSRDGFTVDHSNLVTDGHRWCRLLQKEVVLAPCGNPIAVEGRRVFPCRLITTHCLTAPYAWLFMLFVPDCLDLRVPLNWFVHHCSMISRWNLKRTTVVPHPVKSSFQRSFAYL